MNWGTWQEWLTGGLTFLTGLAAIWATLRATWRKDRQTIRENAAAEATNHQQTQEDAVKKCWDFARNRERWYNDEKRSLRAQIAHLEESVESLRKELHGARNSWSQEQLLRVRLEEELKWLRQDLTDRERDEDREKHPESPPQPLPPPPGEEPGGGA